MTIFNPSSKRFYSGHEVNAIGLHFVGNNVATFCATGHAYPAAGLGVDAHRVAAVMELASGGLPRCIARPGQYQATALEVFRRVG
jgi:hypothetical protein